MALFVSTVSLAFLEPTIFNWMMETMDAENWQQNLIWLPAFFPHVAGVVLVVYVARNFPKWQWCLAMIGLALEGVSCIFLPFSANMFVLVVPLFGIFFGISLIYTTLLPTLCFIMDNKYKSVYGSVYAIMCLVLSCLDGLSKIGDLWFWTSVLQSWVLPMPPLSMLSTVRTNEKFGDTWHL